MGDPQIFPQRLKPHSLCESYGTAEELAEKVVAGSENVPQRLKPH